MKRAAGSLKWLFMATLVFALVGCGSGGGGSTTTNPTYTVTYDGNGNTGGIVPTDSTNYEQGNSVTVLDNTGNLVKTGYAFAGWNTQADGSGTSYSQGQTFTMGSANVTLYAKWTANPTYTVTYNGNGNTGGSVPTDSTNYEQGNSVTVLGNTGSVSKSGYFPFVAWNTQADGSGTSYSQGQTFTMGSANVTLYAKWGTLPDTGQTEDYIATFGEDSDYTINPPSYTDNGDGTITDNVTGLIWQKCSAGQSGADCGTGMATTYNWYQATGTADAAYNPDGATSVCGALVLGGMSGWRLPTRLELMTIVNYGTYSPAINTTYFPATQSSSYWSSATYAGGTTDAWVVTFDVGDTYGGYKALARYVRCVRGQ